MSCPTCGMTMQCVNVEARTWWCPSCGTLRMSAGLQTKEDEVPIVLRRIFQHAGCYGPNVMNDWLISGVKAFFDVAREGTDQAVLRRVYDIQTNQGLWP